MPEVYEWFRISQQARMFHHSCNGYTVTGSRHSRYTESNMYSSCTRVELRLFVHVSDVLYRLHVTSVINTIYSSYQYLQYNEIEPRNGRPITLSLTRLRPGVQSTHSREEPLPIEEELYSKLSCSSGSSKIAAKMLLISRQNARGSRMQSPPPPPLAKVIGYT